MESPAQLPWSLFLLPCSLSPTTCTLSSLSPYLGFKLLLLPLFGHRMSPSKKKLSLPTVEVTVWMPYL